MTRVLDGLWLTHPLFWQIITLQKLVMYDEMREKIMVPANSLIFLALRLAIENQCFEMWKYKNLLSMDWLLKYGLLKNITQHSK